MESKSIFLKLQLDKKSNKTFLKVPSKILKKLGWVIGDRLNFIDNKDGSFTIIKI